MDPTRFDELTRALASATSRRQAKRGQSRMQAIVKTRELDLV